MLSSGAFFSLKNLRIKSKILLILLLISIFSIVPAGLVAYFTAENSLRNSSYNQLTSLRVKQAYEIETYFQSTEKQINILSKSPTVVGALLDFKNAYGELKDKKLTSEQKKELENYYSQNFIPKIKANFEKTIKPEIFIPRTETGKYLQYHYIAKNPYPDDQKIKFDQASDESNYSKIHEKYQPLFREIVEKFGYEDILLVDGDTGNILYTTVKQIEFGTNLKWGIYSDTNVAEAFDDVSSNRTPDFVSTIDFKSYIPSFYRPTGFIATTVFNESEFIGVLIFQAPFETINNIMSTNERWEQIGLGKSGDTLLIAQDSTVRSNPRLFVENPEEYFRVLQKNGTSPETINRIRLANTPVTIQSIKTLGSTEALGGKTGTAIYKDYRGRNVLGAYQPIKFGDLKWGLVAKIDKAEVFEPIDRLLRSLITTLAILLPIITLLSNVFSNMLVRPLRQLTKATERIAAGETDVEVNFKNKDEFYDLANSFNDMSKTIKLKSENLETQLKENNSLLLNIFPENVVKRIQEGEKQFYDLYANITVMYAELEGLNKLSETLEPNKAINLLNLLISSFDEATETFGVEKLKTVHTCYIAVSGLSIPRLDHGKRMVEYALEMLKITKSLNQRYSVNFSLRISLHSGPVYAAILGETKMVYELWGETINIVQLIHNSEKQYTITVTEPIYNYLHKIYTFKELEPLKYNNNSLVYLWSLTLN